jgi:hypothetical protein
MFVHAVTESQAAAFSRFLGVPLISTEPLVQGTDRQNYLSACGSCRSIFLDPDTGVRLHRRERQRSMEVVFAEELVDIAKSRPNGLVLVFDQSVPRGRERQAVQSKLDHFASRGVTGFAYVSQACFLLLGQSSAVVNDARHDLVTASALPEARIATVQWTRHERRTSNRKR